MDNFTVTQKTVITTKSAFITQLLEEETSQASSVSASSLTSTSLSVSIHHTLNEPQEEQQEVRRIPRPTHLLDEPRLSSFSHPPGNTRRLSSDEGSLHHHQRPSRQAWSHDNNNLSPQLIRARVHYLTPSTCNSPSHVLPKESQEEEDKRLHHYDYRQQQQLGYEEQQQEPHLFNPRIGRHHYQHDHHISSCPTPPSPTPSSLPSSFPSSHLPSDFNIWYQGLRIHSVNELPVETPDKERSLKEWIREQPICVLQLDPVDRVVLKIAGM